MAAVLIFNHICWFWQKTALDKLVAMATKKRLPLIYELENFANTYLGKVTKFQGDGFFRFGVTSNLLAWRCKTPPVWLGLIQKVAPENPRIAFYAVLLKRLHKDVSSLEIF